MSPNTYATGIRSLWWNRLLALDGYDLREFGQRHECAGPRPHIQLQQIVQRRLPLRRQRDSYGQFVLRIAVVDRRRVVAGESHAHRVHDVPRRDPGQRGLVLVDADEQLGRAVVHAVVDRHDVLRLREYLAHAGRDRELPLIVRAIDLRDDRRHDRRARRHLDDLEFGAMRGRELLEGRPQGLRDVVRLAAAMVLVDEIHLDVAELRRGPQVVLADQSVEIDRTRGACIRLVVGHLRNLRDLGAEIAEHGRRAFERRACRHVDDHLELRLVVERQHLEHDELCHRQHYRDHDRGTDGTEQLEAVASPGVAAQQRLHAREDPIEPPATVGRARPEDPLSSTAVRARA
jgi:hypothetical protein